MLKMFSKLFAVAVAMGCTAQVFASERAGMLIGYADAGQIDNFQEDAACRFFLKQNSGGVIIAPGETAKIDAEKLDYIWVHIDRMNVGCGNLPDAFSDEATVAALKQFIAEGGNLLLTKQATQLVHKIGRMDAKFAPGIYGDGDGGLGTDVWTVNAQIGYWFTKEDGGNDMNQFYDHRTHPIYKDLRTSDAFEWETYPMEGTGDGTEMWREDHNCMWDLNAYAYTSEGANTVEKFEKDNNAVVLGTWGHVQDHAVAGIVEFLPQSDSDSRAEDKTGGRIIANGLAACEWSPRQGVNAFHSNLEALTANCMNYLSSKDSSSLPSVTAVNADAPVEVYNLQGIRVVSDHLAPGIYIVRQGKETSKILVK